MARASPSRRDCAASERQCTAAMLRPPGASLTSATDLEIWAYAREHDFAVVSKDDDFRSLSLVNGAPPKVIWLRIGNASTAGIEAFIRSALVKIRTFEISPEESLLVLS